MTYLVEDTFEYARHVIEGVGWCSYDVGVGRCLYCLSLSNASILVQSYLNFATDYQ